MNREEKKLQKHFAQQSLGLAARKARRKESRLRKAMRPQMGRDRVWLDPAADWDELVLPSRQRMPKRAARPGREPAPGAGERADAGRHDGVALGLAGAGLRVWRAGDEVFARLPGALLASPPVVGDEVTLAPRGSGLDVVAIAPRRSELVRPDPQAGARPRVVAANFDRVVIVVPAGPLPPRPGLVDRIRLAIGRGGGEPLLCVSKLDLAPMGPLDPALRPLLETGAPLLFCSALSGEGMAALAAHLARGRSVLVGHSGAGKTSLLNALVPGLALATAAVRRSDARGRHTTSAATLVELPGGGQVLDTPGLREFGLWAISRQDLRRHFEEIARLASACRFRDCSHRAEPECAVRAAAGSGELPAGRYRSYLRLLAECVP